MYSAAMDQMIGQQIRTCEVLDEHILSAMRQVPREVFVPAAWRWRAGYFRH
jgi:protein-L-isoaspartate O-methyltransferase